MSELRDWCISRQLWWGHQIPVFYCQDCGAEFATEEEHPETCPKCGSKDIVQDPDVLDTWFSSGLWPFSTLGWGNGEFGKDTLWNEDDLKDFYPNSMLITGFDILFFWVARMMFSGVHEMKEVPFADVYLHALVRDEHGAKMSKSKGNVINPLDMIEEFSADTLRFTLAALAAQGRDIKLSSDRLGQYRNFTNKLFNASRFLLMNEDKFADLADIEVKTNLGRYILSRYAVATKSVRANIDAYRFNDAAMDIYRFFWGEFCDWGIELSKADKESVKELGSIFKDSLKLIHPFMPFISEYLHHELSGTKLEDGNSIMVMEFPSLTQRDNEIEDIFSLVMEAIVGIRRAKATLDLPSSAVDTVHIKLNKDIDLSAGSKYISKLTKVENINFVTEKVENSVADVGDNLEVYISLEGIDLAPIIKRLEAQYAKLEKEVGKLNGMLGNEKFVANAPEDVLAKNRELLENAKSKLEKVESELKLLS
jgi:valyl-tRNA synthetase